MKRAVVEHISVNRKKYLLFFIILIFGIICGIVAYKYLPDEEVKSMQNLIGDYITYLSKGEILSSQSSYFKDSFFTELKTFGLLWLCGIIGAGKIVPCLYILFEGFTLGFTNTIFVNSYQLKGLFFNMTALIPQNLIRIVSLLFALVCMWSLTEKQKNISTVKKSNYLSTVLLYTVLFVCAFLVNALSIFLEAYILPYITVLLTKKMV